MRLAVDPAVPEGVGGPCPDRAGRRRVLSRPAEPGAAWRFSAHPTRRRSTSRSRGWATSIGGSPSTSRRRGKRGSGRARSTALRGRPDVRHGDRWSNHEGDCRPQPAQVGRAPAGVGAHAALRLDLEGGPGGVGAMLGQSLLVALLLCLVFGPLKDASNAIERVQRTINLLFLLAVSCFWLGCNTAAKELVKERIIFLRERRLQPAGGGVLPLEGGGPLADQCGPGVAAFRHRAGVVRPAGFGGAAVAHARCWRR